MESSEFFDGKDGLPDREFVIFKVKSPAVFESVKFGFPNIAGPEVKDSASTADVPDLGKDPDPLEALSRALTFLGVMLGAALIVKVVKK